MPVSTALGGLPRPPCAELLGWEIVDARPGPLYGEGQVVQAGKSIAFLEGKLTGLSGVLLARATATARLVPAGRALSSAG